MTACVPVTVNGGNGVVVPRPVALARRNVDPFGNAIVTSSVLPAGVVTSPDTIKAFWSPATPAISARVD